SCGNDGLCYEDAQGGGGGNACANPYESCDGVPCCDGSVCGDDLICYQTEQGGGGGGNACGYQGDGCGDNSDCCGGFVCGGDGLCYEAQQGGSGGACGYQGDYCADGSICCDGFSCGNDGLCYEDAQGGGGGNGKCQNEGESCANRECCDGLTCSGDSICVVSDGGAACGYQGDSCANGEACCDGFSCGDDGLCAENAGGGGGGGGNGTSEGDVYCAFEGEYCQYLDCCDGLACSEDFACVPSTQGGGGGSHSNTSGGSGSGSGGSSTAPRPVKTPKPSTTPTAGGPQPSPKPASASGGAAATPRAAQPARPARANTLKGEPVFSTAVPADSLPDAKAYALLAQIATIEPGITVDFAKEGLADYPGMVIDFVIDGVEQMTSGGEIQAIRSKAPGAAELIDAGQSVTLNPGDAAVRKIQDGWKVSNTGTAPLRMLHIIVNENGAPTPPPGWTWSDYDFGSPVVEGPVGVMNLAVQRATLEADASVGAAADGSSQAVVQDLGPRGARTSPLVPEPDGFLRNASAKPTTVYTVTISPANG
ncbi:MAG: hypothetical protein ACR2J8_12865, partial [Thermomicrobiales bacterium]